MAEILGTTGSDILSGASGNDTIDASWGNDVVDGGGGDDVITDEGGNDVLRGGIGNDTILLHHHNPGSVLSDYPTTSVIEAGDGNDVVDVELAIIGSALTIDLGAGNDSLTLAAADFYGADSTLITLGSGRDRVNLGFSFGSALGLGDKQIVITDFAAGAGGDVLNLAEMFAGMYLNPSPYGEPLAANPFASGHLKLVQDGADTIIRLDTDGAGPGASAVYTRDFVRLVGVTASQLTAENLGGYAPNGSAPVAQNLTGTASADRIEANGVGSHVTGLGGDDILIGGTGDDDLDGGANNDTLTGGLGNDQLTGGDGNDVLTDRFGDAVLSGGAGDDVIDVSRRRYDHALPVDQPIRQDSISIAGGDGNDRAIIDLSFDAMFDSGGKRGATVTADMGAGNDTVWIGTLSVDARLTLGTGQDRVVLALGDLGDFVDVHTVVINDFAAGAGGDILDIAAALATVDGWDHASNPFAQGYLTLFQQGADTIVAFDYDGVGGTNPLHELVRLRNVDASTLTAFNFDGYAPNRAAPAGLSITGTSANERFDGNAGDDVILAGAGNDVLAGGFGNDDLRGGTGSDRIEGGYGDDRLDGGAGNDVIEDLFAGSDQVYAGDGDDLIHIEHQYSNLNRPENFVIDAGTGNDVVRFGYVSDGSLTANLGDGDDRIYLRSMPTAGTTLTLGAGRDTVVLDPDAAAQIRGMVTITDFATGDSGDRLDWVFYAQQQLVVYGEDFNPFAAGKAWLVQSGADTLLQLGDSAAFAVTYVTFKNTSVASFTDYNLGTDISARPPAPEADTRTGTANADTLNGTANRDVISGLGANDVLSGLAGNDWLRGNDGNDTLYGGDDNDMLDGGAGHDTLDGGAGNDVIDDPYAEDIIKGGSGDDTISVIFMGYGDQPGTGSINAGDGNDHVTLMTNPAYSVALGAGNDSIEILDIAADLTLSLGTGRDTVTFGQRFDGTNGAVVRITDFQTGASGDVVDLRGMMVRVLDPFGIDPDKAFPPGTNAFALGYAELRQNGANVELWLHHDGAEGLYSKPVMVFTGKTLAQFTAANFNGADPFVTPNNAHIIQSDYTVAAGTTDLAENVTPYYYYRTHYAFYYSGDAQLINHGTMLTRQTVPGSAMGVFVDSSGIGPDALFHNAADGVFRVESNWIDESGITRSGFTYGYYAFELATDFINDGLFEVVAASGRGYGVVTGYDVYNPHDTINNGTIRVDAPYEAYGVQLGFNGSFVNNGTLDVHSREYAIGIHVVASQDRELVNNGTLTVTTDPDSPWASIGVLIEQSYLPSIVPVYHFLNTGTISADIAYYAWQVNEVNNAPNLLTNSGVMQGDIYLGRGADVLVNSGFMDGRTLFGAGNDRYEGADGRHDGTVEGGDGDDVMTGGVAGESLFGDAGSDLLAGGAGSDYIDGGSGADTLDGGTGSDTLSYLSSVLAVTVDLTAGTGTTPLEVDRIRGFEEVVGSRGGDTLLGSASGDTLLGFLGDDHIDGRAGDDIVIGGAGDDVLTGGAGSDRFLFDRGDDHDEITDFGAGDRIEIYGHKTYQSIQQIGADVRITLSATDSVLVRGTTVANVKAHLLFSGPVLGITVPGFETESIWADANLVIASGVELALGDTRPLTIYDALPASTLLVLGEGIGAWNAGTLSLHTTGDLTARGIAPVTAGGGINSIVVNQASGKILVTADSSDAQGVTGIGNVWNFGTIEVHSLTGDATGVGALYPFRSVFVNAGTIAVTAAGAASGVVQDLSSSAGLNHYVNSGSVNVHGGAASTGYELHFAVDMWETERPGFVNSGTVVVTDETAAIDSVGLLIGVAAHADVWNSGTVTADFAVKAWPLVTGYLPDSAQYGLSFYNSGTLNGAAYFSQWDDVVVNTGTINGAVFLGEGADVFDGRSGTLIGSLEGYGGNDVLLTGAGSQSLSGGFGDDVLSGGAGADELSGGAGSDSFRFGTGFGHDVVTDFEKGAAHDWIDISGYAAWQTIAQSGADVLITFNASNSLLIRNALVADVMPAVRFGTPGFSAWTIPPPPDAPAAPGQPSAQAQPPYGFPPVYGSEVADVLNGTTGDDDLRGLGGNDTLNGGNGNDLLDGGAGADTMAGGNGNDVYYVDNVGDKAIENASAGSDQIYASVTFSLAGQYTEALTLTGTAAINGTGNTQNNTITGNSAANVLVGGAGDDRLDGGAGADTLRGGLGADTFVIDQAGDIAQENAGEGTDTVEAWISYSLAGQNIEYLKLMGTADLNATGNSLANTLTGNSGNNVLNGGGGADEMYGGAGDDRFVVDNVGDKVFEATGEGTDLVESSVTFSLAGQFLENLTLTGTAAINGTGNSFANVLTGNNAANVLNGGSGDDQLHGGLGADTLTGGAGLDSFWFETALGASNVDDIKDFAAVDDTIYLDRSIFAGIVADGMLDPGAFRVGAAAADADDRIVYDKPTGNLYYDADGAGGAAAVLFAHVVANTSLTAADFFAVP